MKLSTKTLLLLIALAATLAHAQTGPNTPIKHIIVVIQENRTPDNLFQDSTLKANGADIIDPNSSTIQCCIRNQNGTCTDHQVALGSLALANCTNPGHEHSDWSNMYNKGAMDGACNHPTTGACANHQIQYPCPFDPTHTLDCSQYTYVENTQSHPAIQPYWDIAEKYGFANYFFQTNQGPSFPAHQFLFSGSSVPVYPTDTHFHQVGNKQLFYKDDFVANNPVDPNHGTNGDNMPGDNTGCITPFSSQSIPWIEVGQQTGWTPPFPWSYPCYDHATLTDLLDQNQLSWKYYGRTKNDLWEAPTEFQHICQPSNGTLPGDMCVGTEWVNNVSAFLPPSHQQNDAMAPILEDIEDCTLPAVGWVIPDGSWSDHGGKNSDFKGPAWVAAIVNSVGRAPNPCNNGEVYWNDTVILVVWDDWGGFYDHVLPWRCDSSGTCQGYSNGTGAQYTYGFRVPFLVVSAYAKPGYISGKCLAVGNCPNKVPPYVHDFGSILNFIEWALGQDQTPLHFPGQPPTSGISPTYAYADVLAPDAPPSCITCSYSLADFFDFTTQHAFQPISLPPNYTQYDAEWFEDFNGTPTDPDDDATDPQN